MVLQAQVPIPPVYLPNLQSHGGGLSILSRYHALGKGLPKERAAGHTRVAPVRCTEDCSLCQKGPQNIHILLRGMTLSRPLVQITLQ